ncbi:MAG: branched-chain amino acid ABC transporter permease [Actinomycetota bacterium]
MPAKPRRATRPRTKKVSEEAAEALSGVAISEDGATLEAHAAAEAIIAEEVAESEAPQEQAAGTAWSPTRGGWIARRLVAGAIIAIGILAPLRVSETEQLDAISLALIYVMVGLSINVLMGYLGQISLGHQAFVGVGAFTAARLASKAGAPFIVNIVAAGISGAVAAMLLGVVALRLKGLYLALITLAYGTVAADTIFNTPAITGGGAGAQAIRPGFMDGDRAFIYVCMLVVALFLYFDWRMVRSKVGRAIFAIRENELAAASFGINVTVYKLVAFVLSGIMAGIAGALFGYRVESVDAGNFDFALALTFVLMVVVGGLGSRVGVFIGSAFFALIDLLIHSLFGTAFGKWLAQVSFIAQLEIYPQFIGAMLLLLTLTLAPGGIAQQIRPVTNWLSGKRFRERHGTVAIREGGAGVRP